MTLLMMYAFIFKSFSGNFILILFCICGFFFWRGGGGGVRVGGLDVRVDKESVGRVGYVDLPATGELC